MPSAGGLGRLDTGRTGGRRAVTTTSLAPLRPRRPVTRRVSDARGRRAALRAPAALARPRRPRAGGRVAAAAAARLPGLGRARAAADGAGRGGRGGGDVLVPRAP